MRITADSPRNIANVPRFSHVIVRVITGDALIGRDRQTVSDGGGLPIAVGDGIVNLHWDIGELWVAGSPTVTMEVLIP